MKNSPDSPHLAFLDNLITGVRTGNRRLLARCLRRLDDHRADAEYISRTLFSATAPSKYAEHNAESCHHAQAVQVIGITGNPGAGKSTVVDKLIQSYRDEDKRVAVLAIDPSSPFSGGAILGDRIRMQRHWNDSGVFIHSLATRGNLGGLSGSTCDAVNLLRAAPFDVVLVETVGVGQDEVDIIRLADTTVVVLVPGLGDDIQAIKAGLLEIADVFVINKADRPGVPDLERALHNMLALAPPPLTNEIRWQPPILQSIATTGEGITEMRSAMKDHQEFLNSAAGETRKTKQRLQVFQNLLQQAFIHRGYQQLGENLQSIEQEFSSPKSNPYEMLHKALSLLDPPTQN